MCCTEKSMAKKEIKIFLDSNVILSGFIFDKAAPRLILDLLCHDLTFLVGATGQYNLEEIERTIRRKLPAVVPVFRESMSRMKIQIVPMPVRGELDRYRGAIDDADLPVLVSAIQSNADYLVTGDRKHFSGLRGRNDIPVKICTPAEFIDVVAACIKEMG